MRSNESIKITMKIPFPINEPDRNGVVYTKEAIEKAVNDFDGSAPLIIIKDDIVSTIGHINKLNLSEDYEIIADGVCYFGGTCEETDVEGNIITDFNFTSFGLCNK